jgi:putative chitinase
MTIIVKPAHILAVTHLAHGAIIVPVCDAFNKHAPDYGVGNVNRLANFWGESCHETNQFQTLHEYGDAAYFARYNNRADLGNGPHDGPIFFGRGIFQVTGRANYLHLGSIIGVDLIKNPERAAEPEIAVLLALEFWKSRNLNAYADAGNIMNVAVKINGRNKKTNLPNGWEDRKRFTSAFLGVFTHALEAAA